MNNSLDSTITKTACVLGLVAATGTLAWLFSSKPYVHKIGGRESPPGPKRKFLVGNAKNFPVEAWMEAFTELQKIYGDIIYFEVPGRPILVLNLLEDAEDLLGKRANVWSSRPQSYITALMSYKWGMAYLPPGNEHNEQKKIFNQVLGPRAVTTFDSMLNEGAEELCRAFRGFSGDPENITSHAVGAIIIRITYGDQVYKLHGEELIKLNTEGISFSAWYNSQIWLVNMFPLARHLPSWFPGIKFHAYVKKGTELFGKIRYRPYDLVKQDVDNGTADLSVISKYLSDDEHSNGYLRDATALMYFAGVDTTNTALLNFIANMLLYPEVQRKVQQELDEVIGHSRCPTVNDLSSLTYLKAVWKESARLTPVAPSAVPHASTSDDHWKGYFIPTGTMVIANVGFMMTDSRVWGDDVDIFKPERFIGANASSIPDAESLMFGFGRRRCPGRYLVERNGPLYAAAVLSAYEILPIVGAKTPIKIKFGTKKIRQPTNLKCRFVPRQ